MTIVVAPVESQETPLLSKNSEKAKSISIKEQFGIVRGKAKVDASQIKSAFDKTALESPEVDLKPEKDELSQLSVDLGTLNQDTAEKLGVVLGENAESKGSETSSSFLEMAKANGIFYNALVDLYLSKHTDEERQTKLDEMIEGLPVHARGLYKKGLEAFQNELRHNTSLLGQHQGKEIEYLIGGTIEQNKIYRRDKDEILRRVKSEDARLWEPTKGIPIILADIALSGFLRRYDLIQGGGKYYGGWNKDNPVYIIVKELDRDLTSLAVKHEFHHLVWNFLERSGFVREPKDASPELEEGFWAFRDEFAAYILIGDDFKDYFKDSDISKSMTFTHDKDVNKIAEETKSLAATCINAAKKRGIDMQAFLYPAMISRNFAEFRANLMKLIPVEINSARGTVAA